MFQLWDGAGQFQISSRSTFESSRIRLEIAISNKINLLGLSVVAMLAGVNVLAADQARDRNQDRIQTQDQSRRTVGRKLMTSEERPQQRAKMRGTKSKEEREKVRAEHHEEMKERAKE